MNRVIVLLMFVLVAIVGLGWYLYRRTLAWHVRLGRARYLLAFPALAARAALRRRPSTTVAASRWIKMLVSRSSRRGSVKRALRAWRERPPRSHCPAICR